MTDEDEEDINVTNLNMILKFKINNIDKTFRFLFFTFSSISLIVSTANTNL